MIKKITTCFLVMAIAVGCAQAPVEPEKPEEPPVLKQPQKPEEEAKVKKIEDYVERTTTIIDLKGADILNVDEQLVEKINIKIDSADVQSINGIIEENYNRYLGETVFYSGDDNHPINQWHTTSFYRIATYLNNDILSIVTKANRYLFQAGSGNSEFETYNIDVITGKSLNNTQLAFKNGTTLDKLSDIIRKKLGEEIIDCMNLPENESGLCYQVDETEFSINLNEESNLYIGNNNNFEVYIGLFHAWKDPMEKIVLN